MTSPTPEPSAVEWPDRIWCYDNKGATFAIVEFPDLTPLDRQCEYIRADRAAELQAELDRVRAALLDCRNWILVEGKLKRTDHSHQLNFTAQAAEIDAVLAPSALSGGDGKEGGENG